MITTLFQSFAQEVEDFILGLFKIISSFLAFFGFNNIAPETPEGSTDVE